LPAPVKIIPKKPVVTPVYRSVCVRLCDGAYFPVSPSVKADQFERDEQLCKSRCNSPAELYIYRADDGSPDTMEDLEGRPYVRLTTAFKYRVTYDAGCTCKPHPWEEASLARHRQYAEQQQKAAPQGKRAEFQSLRPSLAAEFKEADTAGQSRRLLAAAPAEVMTDAADLPPVSAQQPPVSVEPLELPEAGLEAEDGEDRPEATVAPAQSRPRKQAKPVRLTRPAFERPKVTRYRQSTASDDFMLNFRR
jgi:hypothetical protein